METVDRTVRRAWRARGTPYAALALLSYVPLLLARPGVLNADTKGYLYLDPLGLMERARSLWDPVVGGGTVTHQTIGYLWPMGPFYALTEAVGLPDWVAQRLWVGSISFAAAAGALHLWNHLLGRRGVNVLGALAYGLSPYVLGHVTGQSALLLPFAAFPWLVVFMDRACTEKGWRWPAAYALVIATCGSLNGSSVFFVVVGSALWAPLRARSTAGVTLRDAFVALVRTGVLTLATQLWWLVGYAVGGRYGLPLLATTETLEVTSATTASTEVLRGLGYWFFYGTDVTGPWLEGIAPPYMEHVGLLAVGFVVPIVALVAGGATAWAHRTYFATLAALGLVLSVGAYSAAGRSPFGAAFAAGADASDLLFSLRNTQRATPLLLLGLAGLLVAGLHVLAEHRPRGRVVVHVALAVAVVASIPHHWTSGYIAERFHRPDELPAHWVDAADHLADGEGRILELPGIDFAAYRWGNTLDPITPGLVDRSVLARELVPMGSPPGVDLLGALDRSIQEGTFEPEALAPVARLLGASDVLVRSDLEYERYRTVRPRVFWDALTPTPPGLGPPTTFGDDQVNRADPSQPMIDEVELGIAPDAAEPPALAVFPVEDPHDLVRAEPTAGGTILAGDGEGVLATAAAGLLSSGPLRYAAEVTDDPAALDLALSPGTQVVLTDTNRLRGHRWYSLRENLGAVEVPGQPALEDDPGDARIPPVTDPDPSSQTVAEHRGAARVWATAYGNPITMTPENRAVLAFDGDERTAWTVETGQWDDPVVLGIELDQAVAVPAVHLRQAVGRPGMRAVEEVEIRLDGGRALRVALDERSLEPGGQPVPLDGDPVTTVEVEVLRSEPGDGPTGFSEVRIPDVRVEEVLHLPTDLVDAVGPGLVDHPLAIVLTRHRVNPAEVVRSDPELAMSRAFTLPAAGTFDVSGTARLSATAPEPTIDRTLGIAGAADGGVDATSTARLAGDLRHRAVSAVDDDLTTAWQTTFGDPRGATIEVASPTTFTLDALTLDVVADGRHSLPRTLEVRVDGQGPVVVEVPPVAESTEPGATTQVVVPLGTTVEGSTLRLTVVEIDERSTRDWYTGTPVTLPVGLAEIEVPGAEVTDPVLDESCRADLLSIDGTPVPLRVVGTAADAVDRAGLDVELCGDPVTLAAGEHVVRTAPGADTAIDLDRVVLELAGPAASAAVPAPDAPATVEWTRPSATAIDATVVPEGDEPFWLVVSESWNEGWTATADGEDLGEPAIHDAFGMGWVIEPGDGPIDVELRWAPQRTVDIGLAASALAAVACLALVVFGRRRPQPPRAAPTLVRDATWSPLAAPAALVAGALLVHPLAGLVLGLVVGAGVLWPRARPAVRLLPAIAVALAAAYVVVSQLRWGHPADFRWPEHFLRVHHLALAGPVLLAVLAWFDAPAQSGSQVEPSEPSTRPDEGSE
ncbi:alpha-(1-_3)-arabinofuranosyltransferase domain-containing protein [Actinomarinicola tropica]|uniref:alpha-(1->3)-arabinofuranosyltransferase domain-containing protein n=1 Tax=Actinomarinicola tropica TaxID=2789776 RepID=UPI00189B1493|nr:alpha-(1->3)-arabinofuranosyltransferase family protein [Actinomarinicola tropica]